MGRRQTAPRDGRVRRTEEPPRDGWWHDGRRLPVAGDVVCVHNGSVPDYCWCGRVLDTYESKYGPRWLVDHPHSPVNAWTCTLSRLRPTIMTAEGPRCADCGRLGT